MSGIAQLRAILNSRWRARPSGRLFEVRALSDDKTNLLPRDYCSLAPDFGGKEGFLGRTYLRLYGCDEVLCVNQAYEVPTLFPGYFVFGSNGAGQAFGFELKTG